MITIPAQETKEPFYPRAVSSSVALGEVARPVRDTHESAQVLRQFSQPAEGVSGFTENDVQMHMRHQLVGSRAIVQQNLVTLSAPTE